MPVPRTPKDDESKVVVLPTMRGGPGDAPAKKRGKPAARAFGGGVDGVADAIRAGRREAGRLRERFRDPDIGGELTWNGEAIPPGGWTPDLWGLPPACPIQVLGKNGQTLYIVDSLGQLRPLAAEKLGQKTVQELCGDRQNWLYWAFPRYRKEDKKIVAWRNELFVEMVATAAHRRGLWNDVEKVRGLGAWLDNEGKLIYHAGDAIFRAGHFDADGAPRAYDPGEIEGYFYPRRPSTLTPWPAAVTAQTNPALDIFRTLQTFTWERPQIDPLLLIGWTAAAFLGGALPWRPACFVVGDRAVGKSTLNHLLKDIFGPGLHDTADTTPAGIYQRVGQDSLPVAVDELEADADNRRQQGVIRLARLAASGARMYRGGSEHTGTEFTARNCFFFSAINPPPMPPQDLSRLVLLNLRKLPAERAAQAVARLSTYTVGRMFLRRLMDEWTRFSATYEAYRAALASGGHDGRGQDTYGIALACADLLLGPDLLADLGFPVETLDEWARLLPATALPEVAEAHENWRACLTHLLTSQVQAWRDGHRRTVGQLMDDCCAPGQDGLELKYVRNYLAQAGLGLIDGREKQAGFILAVPHAHPLVAALFRDTVWAGAGATGGWSSALRQGPADVVLTADAVLALSAKRSRANYNVVKVGGVPLRCSLVSLDAFRRMMEA